MGEGASLMTLRKLHGNQPVTKTGIKLSKPGLLKFILEGGSFADAGKKYGISKQTASEMFHTYSVRVFPGFAINKNKCDLDGLREFWREING